MRYTAFLLIAGTFASAPLLSPGRFVDATAEAGLVYRQLGPLGRIGSTVHLQSGGAAAFDYDADGWVDLFVTRMDDTDILFRNLGPDPVDGVVRFEDVSAAAGFTQVLKSNGVAAVDVENDGDLDLYITSIYDSRFYLYINNGDGTFTEEARRRQAELTLDRSTQPGAVHHGFGVAAGDYDRDGWLDLHVTEWDIDYAVGPSAGQFRNTGRHNTLLRNLGVNAPGFYGNATDSAGVRVTGLRFHNTADLYTQYGFASAFVDMDDDGWPDLLVAGDHGTSQLFWNNRDGTFTEGTEAAGVGLDENGMGIAFGDYDGDGRLDWFVTSITDNRLYRNLGNRRFEELGEALGLFRSGWNWGTAFLDHDNDSDLDLVMVSGYEDRWDQSGTTQSRSRSAFWRNEGDGSFTEIGSEIGIDDMEPGKGVLVFDYDRDGDLDVFVVNNQGTPILYRNDTANDHAWLRVNLVGSVSNRQGIGARLKLRATPGAPEQVREIIGGTSFLSQSELTAHFGLGSHTGPIAQLEVRWPSGKVQTLTDLEAGQEITLIEPVTYAEWLQRYFRAAERDDPAVSGKAADPDGDGRTNFEEYAWGSHPRQAASGGTAVASPGTVVATPQGAVVRLARPPAAPADVVYRYQASDDLKTWQTRSESAPGEPVVLADGASAVVHEVPLEGEASGPSFFRIEAVDR